MTAFLADTDPKKRAKLIDRLLDHPEFVDYWAYKWSDLLLVSSRKLPQPAMWAFYRGVRQSVADNKPWDAFARDILTATGSTLTNGGGNYFVLHKDVSDLAESTAITFLGTSDQLREVPQPPAGEVDPGPILGVRQPVLARRPEERRPRRRGARAEPSRRRRAAPAPRRRDAADAARRQAAARWIRPTDRRAYFADWLTSPNNPYFAKAVVNRVWKNYMGRGLVEAEDDLRETNPPSNRELFDALAADFVKNKFDVKHLMRTILNSAAYQRSSKPLTENATDDRFYSRYLLRRLPGEVILDAYSDITGVPTPFDKITSAAGDATTPIATYPTGTRAMQVPDSLATSRFLDAFGRAERVADVLVRAHRRRQRRRRRFT